MFESFVFGLGGLRYQRIKCAMKSYKLSELSSSEVESLKARPRIDFSSIFGTVSHYCSCFGFGSFLLFVFLGRLGIW